MQQLRLSSSIIAILEKFAPVFSQPVISKLKVDSLEKDSHFKSGHPLST